MIYREPEASTCDHTVRIKLHLSPVSYWGDVKPRLCFCVRYRCEVCSKYLAPEIEMRPWLNVMWGDRGRIQKLDWACNPSGWSEWFLAPVRSMSYEARRESIDSRSPSTGHIIRENPREVCWHEDVTTIGPHFIETNVFMPGLDGLTICNSKRCGHLWFDLTGNMPDDGDVRLSTFMDKLKRWFPRWT
jgi:hypothetical protein